MIRPATFKDIPQIKNVWERCFDDPINYVDFLYDRVSPPEKTLVWEEDGEIRAMAAAIDCSFCFREQALKCVYIYGCATLPEYEWQSIQGKLISRIEEEAEARGAQMSLIIPGNMMLYSFYRKQGYTSEFPYRELVLRSGVLEDTGEPDTPVVDNRITNTEMYAIREEALYHIPHVRWSEKQIDFLTLDAITYGEHLASYSGEKGKSYVVYAMRKNHMYVRECLGTTDEAVRTILSVLIDQNNPRRVHMRLPLGGGLLPFEGHKKKYGLAKLFSTGKTLSDFEPYMNLMLD